MRNSTPKLRIGNGYDIHRLVENRDLIIGGVKLHHPDNLGLDGHSDADVLSHSIMDALLGALSLGDIGKYFPPSDEKWKDADSLFLLSKVIELIRQYGWEINNKQNLWNFFFKFKLNLIFSQVELLNGNLYPLLSLLDPIFHS